MNGEVFDELTVEKIFPLAKETWNALYVTFAYESSIHTVYKYSRYLQKSQRIIPYIPKQFYQEYKRIESLAYNLRHNENKYKTRVRMGVSK